MQRSLANSAFIGENKVEKTASYPYDGAPNAIGHHPAVLGKTASETGEQATREDPPPPKTSFYNIVGYSRI